VTIKKTASIRVGKRGKKTETHKAKSKEKKTKTLRKFEKKNTYQNWLPHREKTMSHCWK
jgi:hypothetical protein